MNKAVFVAIVVIVFFQVCSAWACIGDDNAPFKLEERQHAHFNRLDTNKDGHLTLGEYVIGHSNGRKGGDVDTKPFVNHDLNKSGDLSWGEWKKFHPLEDYATDCIQ